jgi:hypothetical protein
MYEAKSIFFGPDAFTLPPEDRMIWRYMNVGQFLSLITTETLFFSSAAAMEDPYEGFYPLPSRTIAAATHKKVLLPAARPMNPFWCRAL